MSGFSQESKASFTDRLFYGGSLGASFGNITFIDVSPVIGYNITDRWQAGTQISYQYYSDNRLNFNASLYGASIFTRYFVWNDIYGQVEFEGLNGPWRFEERYTVYNYYVGAGYIARLGSVAGISFTLLYNLNTESPVIGSNPTVNIGFVYGLR